jgi:hypothetical protein
MKTRKPGMMIAGLLAMACAARADDWLDQLDESMRVSFFKGTITANVSGLMDMEGYYTEQPNLGLISNGGSFLFNPRLTIYLDVQITPAIYISAEARVDRGFDPSNENLEARFDEYAISYKPLSYVPVSIQAGKFASVVGTYSERYDSWDNPFINAPLPYENLTSVNDKMAPASPEYFVDWRHAGADSYNQLPIMWGPSYASGFALFAEVGETIDLSAEVKNASISSRPESWDFDSNFLRYPTWSGHADWKPSPTWQFGVSGSVGPYLQPGTTVEASDDDEGASFPKGKGIGDYDQETIAEDVTYAWRHWQIWAEFFETRFEVPNVGDADTFAYYLEAKYKFTPQLFAALRWNQQLFSKVPSDDNDPGEMDQWGNDIWRIDAAVTYRWTPRIQTKLQYSFTDQSNGLREDEHLVAGQFTVKY